MCRAPARLNNLPFGRSYAGCATVAGTHMRPATQ
ncbi:hypothetical protein BSFP_025140 [Burkholderia stabilis]|uniref:Uncharacterized protein n=1 Tax=Burkholderia stabilis TaxID=95485 RepID=A0A1Y1BIF2_9BURK|nr:hypothetical protein BSFP_025140 [Burkholderia stabilis]